MYTMTDTIILDSREEIAKIDLQNVLGSVEELPNQCLDAWEQTRDITVPDSYSKIANIVTCGMGGSGLGARVIESVYAQSLRYPLVRVNDYNLPGFVNENTLVICSAYSGTTEEPVECARQAIKKKAKWMAIGTGNTLLDMAKTQGVPFYQIVPTYNPSNQPRMAIGYSVIGQLVLASKAGLFTMSRQSITNIVKIMGKVLRQNKVEVTVPQNKAKELAMKMAGKQILFISARHLVGSLHVFNNQLNENAKNLSYDVVIPELNHHLMEGLKHPHQNPENILVFFADSKLYPPRIRQRFAITKEVIKKNNLEYFEYELTGKTKLGQAFELIQFGAHVNLYLSILYGQNPAPIPWVDYFKNKLGQPLGK